MSDVLAQLVRLISRLPPEGLSAIARLLALLLRAQDPLAAVQRASVAAASSAASEAALRRALRPRGGVGRGEP